MLQTLQPGVRINASLTIASCSTQLGPIEQETYGKADSIKIKAETLVLMDWIQIQAMPLSSCVILSMYLSLFKL